MHQSAKPIPSSSHRNASPDGPRLTMIDDGGNGSTPNRLPAIFPTTQFGNADRLMHYHGDDLRFCFPWKTWLTWTGTHWQQDDTGEVWRRCENVITDISREAKHASDLDERAALFKWCEKSSSASGIADTLRIAQSRTPILPSQLDADRNLLSVQNGTLELLTGDLREHSRDDCITNCVEIPFDPDAECPTWLKFLDDIMAGDTELIAFLQRAVGLSLTGDVGEQVLFFLYGSGKNGKSTFTGILEKLLGSYWHKTNAETLMASNRSGEGPSPEKLALKGKRLVTVSEVGQGKRLDEALIKDLTGGDPITARGLHQSETTFLPQHKIWMYGNHKPVVRGTDTGIWRRIRLIPFTVTISEEQRDPDLPHKLEAELSGILTWAVAGTLLWRANGLQAPEKIHEATQGYREEMDVLGAFIEDACELGIGTECGAGEIYQAYSRWADRGGEHKMSKRALGLALKERGFVAAKSTGGRRVWEGISLRPLSGYGSDE